jgi:Uma2 family endonuclease
LLYGFLKESNKGKVIPAPTDVYMESKESVVQPDLIVLLNESLGKIKSDGIYGAPDIVIEILSRNRNYDTQKKRVLYEQAGVKEYFMIDPDNRKTTLLTLNSSGIYAQTYEEAGRFQSFVLNLNVNF